jgi:hypothetical protein
MKDTAMMAPRGVNGNPNRRSVLAGLAALATARSAAAEETDSPVARGMLANNALAQAFESVPIYQLPDVTLMGPNGE